MAYVSHPRIRPDTVEERGYQTRMVERCRDANALLILPTGLGKTVIAVRVAAEFLDRGKVLVLAPTKPLAEQHAEAFSSLLVDTTVSMLSGRTRADHRAPVVGSSDVVVSTPQTVANDLEAGRYDLSAFSLVVYDEAHRGRGDYDYVAVARHVPKGARSVGMTASPGSSIERIEEVCLNLGLRRIEMRTESDPDVSPYVHDTYVNRVEVSLPEDILDISALLNVMLDHFYKELCSLGMASPRVRPTKGYLLRIGSDLQARASRPGADGIVFRGLSVDKTCIQLLEAVNKVETEGTTVLRAYLDRLEAEAAQEKGGRAAQAIVRRQEYAAVRGILDRTQVEHPKVSRVMSIVSQALSSREGSKVLVFAQFRDACEMLVSKLSAIPGARVSLLIGQSKGGMSQNRQVSLLEAFRAGESNVLVSTSVGEEGLDVSNTDAVVFYEPVPSEIRTIQRRGRTGRRSDGEVYVLIAKGTVDEAFERSSRRKEEEMRRNLELLSDRLSRGMSLGDGGQTRLEGFEGEPRRWADGPLPASSVTDTPLVPGGMADLIMSMRSASPSRIAAEKSPSTPLAIWKLYLLRYCCRLLSFLPKSASSSMPYPSSIHAMNSSRRPSSMDRYRTSPGSNMRPRPLHSDGRLMGPGPRWVGPIALKDPWTMYTSQAEASPGPRLHGFTFTP